MFPVYIGFVPGNEGRDRERQRETTEECTRGTDDEWNGERERTVILTYMHSGRRIFVMQIFAEVERGGGDGGFGGELAGTDRKGRP